MHIFPITDSLKTMKGIIMRKSAFPSVEISSMTESLETAIDASCLLSSSGEKWTYAT